MVCVPPYMVCVILLLCAIFSAIRADTRIVFIQMQLDCRNNLDTELHERKSLETFKKCITSVIKSPQKSLFRIYNPRGTGYIFQLGVGLSPLRSHKKRHNFQETRGCTTANETTEHYILLCPLYRAHRLKMTASIMLILLQNDLLYLESNPKLYLYGCSTLCSPDNRIILSVIKYIIETNRFS